MADVDHECAEVPKLHVVDEVPARGFDFQEFDGYIVRLVIFFMYPTCTFVRA